MKKILSIILLISSFLFVIPCQAAHYGNVYYGDSIMEFDQTYYNNAVEKAVQAIDGLTYKNRGASAMGTAYVIAIFENTYLAQDTPVNVYNMIGVNDVTHGSFAGASFSTWIGNHAQMYSDCVTAGCSYHAIGITPAWVSGHDYTSNIKYWDAYLRELSTTDNFKYTDLFLEMTLPSDENHLYPSGDNLHPSDMVIYSYMVAHEAIPPRSITWGDGTNYPKPGYESFSYWILTNTSGNSSLAGTNDSVTGHLKTATLTLSGSDYAVSDVLCIVPSNANLSIGRTGSGSPTIRYRHSASGFLRADSNPSWVTYSGSFAPIAAGVAEYIQIEIVNASVTTQANLTWAGSGGSDTTPPTPVLPSSPQAISSDSYMATGTATDDTAVIGCKWRLTAEPDATHGTPCTGTTAWSCNTSGFSVGSNTLYIECYDAVPNYSTGHSITVNYTPLINLGTTFPH